MEDKHQRRHKILLLGAGAYLVGVSAFMLRRNVWLSPDQFFAFALLAALFFGKGKKFVRDWTPFVLVLLGYEYLRGAVPAIVKFPVHSTDLIRWEQSLFGSIPTIVLQKSWLHPPSLSWYDLVFALSYMSYFIIPLVLAFFAWLKIPRMFRFFAIGYIVLHFLAFVTWVFFPAMPPWMAAEKGLLPPIQRVLYLATAKLTISAGGFPTLYHFIAANPVAAVPSLHAALPTLMLMVAIFFRRKILTMLCLVYAFVVWIGIIYLGEHYIVDAIIGIIYAIISFLVVVWFSKQRDYLLYKTVKVYLSNLLRREFRPAPKTQ